MDGYYVKENFDGRVALLQEGKGFTYDSEAEQWTPNGEVLFVWRDSAWRRIPEEEAEALLVGQRQLQRMKLHEAIAFATQAHQGQCRKGSGLPYIVHPFEVAQILTEADCPPFVVIAGLLHDTLEDTETSPGEIASRFGPRVLALVQGASEDKSLSWEERKQHTIDYLRTEAGFEQLLLSCGDKLSNLRSMRADAVILGDLLWGRFNRGKEAQRWYYEGMLDALAPLEDYEMYQELERLFGEVFGG